MAITQDEMQSIVNTVLSAIRTNSRTIDQLTPVTSLSIFDSFEINGGKRITFALLRELITKLESEARTNAIAELNKRLNSILGESASEAIDNFNEILSFLSGINDDEKLATMLADLSAADKKHEDKILALQQSVWPLEVVFNVSPKTVEVGIATNLHVSWDVKRDGKSVLDNSVVTPSFTAEPGLSAATIDYAPSSPENKAFSISAVYDGITATASVNVTAVYPTYFGKLAASAAITESAVKGMAKLVNPSKSFRQSAISLTNDRICIAYPKVFGALASVKDGNNFETLTAYTRSELSIGGVAYYVYAMTEPVTATNVTQIYS